LIRAFEGLRPRLAEGAWVDASAQVIGDVQLGEDSSIWPLATVRGDVNRIRIGARSNVQDNACLHVTHDGPYTPGGLGLEIGEEVTVGHGVILHACTIGNRVLIGMGAIVMDQAVIEDEVLLAAGSLVPPGKRLESGHLYRGNPLAKVRPLSEAERASLKYSAEHYVRVKNRHVASGG
jgi:carbonic anhydrase/acetyltransferase-like protein (isoleucine patch superfamily)